MLPPLWNIGKQLKSLSSEKRGFHHFCEKDGTVVCLPPGGRGTAIAVEGASDANESCSLRELIYKGKQKHERSRYAIPHYQE